MWKMFDLCPYYMRTVRSELIHVLSLSSREGVYRYNPGTTAVLTKTVTPLFLDVVEETVRTMDTE